MERTHQENNFAGRIIIGLLLLAAGAIMLLTNLGMIDNEFSRYVFSWPVILIIVGLAIYINSRDFSGLAILFIGTIFLLGRIYHFNAWTFWPVILILLGAHILFGRRTKKNHSKSFFPYNPQGPTLMQDSIDDAAIFGGGEKSFVSENFSGGKITAVFGGSEIDLSDCKLAPGENIIDMTVIFGGTTLYVPKDWKIIIKVFPLFGGFSDSRRKDPSVVYPNDRVLVLKGLVVFGGGEIKSAK